MEYEDGQDREVLVEDARRRVAWTAVVVEVMIEIGRAHV